MLAAAGAPLSFSGLATASGTAHPSPIDDTFDSTWADRVQGKFRAVFDSPALNDGAGFYRAMMWISQYKQMYGTVRSDMSPVLVLRHQAIPLIMGDEYWSRYKIGKATKIKTMDGKNWTPVNPIRANAPGTPASMADYNLEHFMQEGGIVLACNIAFGQVVSRVRKEEKLDGKAARERALALMIPGVILQPSGVFAALRAQEAGCKYILAS